MKIGSVLFVLAVVLAGSAIGILNIPAGWYAALVKPAFNPPDWVFGPVWTVLYIFIGIAGWRTWQQEGFSKPFMVWLIQMALNYIWSPIFFGLHRLETALFILVLLLLSILIFIQERWHHDRLSATLFLPYAAWVTFAGILNLNLILLN